jgi:hypothetical protein
LPQTGGPLAVGISAMPMSQGRLTLELIFAVIATELAIAVSIEWLATHDTGK